MDGWRWLNRSGWGNAVVIAAVVLVPILILGLLGLAFHGTILALLATSAVSTTGLLLFALGARRAIARVESVSIGPAGMSWRGAAGPVAVFWNRVTSITALGTPQGPTVIRIEGPKIVVLRLHLLRNRERVLGALKEYGAHAYRLDETAEQHALSGTPALRRIPSPPARRAAHAEPASYRTPTQAPEHVAIAPHRVLLGRHGLRWVGIPALLAAGGIGVTWALSGHSRWVLVPFVATALSGLVASVTASLFVAEWRWQHRLASFLGRDVVCSGSLIRSEDGRRRLRFAAADLRDPYAGAHRHLEELDAEGLTVRTYQQRMRPAEPATPERAKVAVVSPARWEPRCFRGLPWGRGAEAPEPMDRPAVLLVHRTEDGVSLTRFAQSRRHAGDTLHRTMAEAEAQIAAELGVDSVAWREVALQGPWSFWPDAAARPRRSHLTTPQPSDHAA